ncbi:TetR/AcrR family transcriptional regulator [Thiohalomonas denitrificans]|uniref:Transcriptional regulator, TetR family n=1 Tax=Thiohalomonas denitrificans TaxID=415747 RepID=A0A1G5PKH1_9GAMM|nr:TetR/AcrR family transcriptional regulator [Thiohalomonas denitrificans]SCZ49992.1 transcriptional regulator, TetR family [Thiohalomonas denitrificans]
MGKPTEERRQEIIEATLELAGERGVKKVTTQAIADKVKIAQPTVFRHFKSRDAIFSAAIGFIAERLFQVLEGDFAGKAPPDQRLQQLIRRQLAFIGSARGLPRLLFSDRLHLESPQLKRTVRTVMERYIARIEALLQEGMESGCFRSDLAPDVVASWIAALVQGLVMRWSIYDFDFPLEDKADEVWAFIEPALKDNR